ncbi:translocation protein [Tilletiaria anomala UBC 951]|uniref:Translocation protein SEC62 n=1 Tax=Tilletiaria anomala (strain ATCC 24038 / CBS 436.72 / UBC 951) TaxID=1037660 RepID=A0A066VMB6_TILAU|nr:translocation protein [Tilletiaria anomala UBC 951]KDN42857.1 translocation protein [Tilletiaria anomala UBC 951]
MEQQSSASKETRVVVDFLRGSKSSIKPHVGVLNGKRVEYFKGSKATAALLSPAYAKLKGAPPVANEEEANKLLHGIIPYAFFLRADKGPKTKEGGRVLQINTMQMFQPELYYVWLYEGSQLGVKLAGLGMVAVMLAGVMFPLWPPIMRQGVWYLSIGALGLIGLFIAIAIFRLIFYVITIVVARPGIWIFPNLFEDVGFVDSFKPLWAWDIPPPPKKKKTLSIAVDASHGTTQAKRQAVANLPGIGPVASPQMNATPQAVAATPTTANAPSVTPSNSDANGGFGAQQQQPPLSASANQQQYDKLDELD